MNFLFFFLPQEGARGICCKDVTIFKSQFSWLVEDDFRYSQLLVACGLYLFRIGKYLYRQVCGLFCDG